MCLLIDDKNIHCKNFLYKLCLHSSLFITVRPDIPRNLTVNCDQTGARIQWISGFNGGDTQTFKVFILNGKDKISSDRIFDNGENLVHSNYIQNLQPSVTYAFYVSAFNQRGYSSSDNLTCTTLNKGIFTFVVYSNRRNN